MLLIFVPLPVFVVFLGHDIMLLRPCLCSFSLCSEIPFKSVLLKLVSKKEMLRRFVPTASLACSRAVGMRCAAFSTTKPFLEKYYSDSHEWIEFKDGGAVLGISDHAQETLGDVVFVGLPTVGDTLEAKATLAEIESVKATSDIFTPVAGVVDAVNEELKDHPQKINESPEDEGWIAKLKDVNQDEAAAIKGSHMSSEAYAKFLEAEEGN